MRQKMTNIGIHEQINSFLPDTDGRCYPLLIMVDLQLNKTLFQKHCKCQTYICNLQEYTWICMSTYFSLR